MYGSFVQDIYILKIYTLEKDNFPDLNGPSVRFGPNIPCDPSLIEW